MQSSLLKWASDMESVWAKRLYVKIPPASESATGSSKKASASVLGGCKPTVLLELTDKEALENIVPIAKKTTIDYVRIPKDFQLMFFGTVCAMLLFQHLLNCFSVWFVFYLFVL